MSADAIATLTVVQDNADFLTQVASLVGQVRNLDSLTDDQKRSLIQGALSDVKKTSPVIGLARQATRKADADPTLAARIQAAQTVLAAAIGDVKTAVSDDPLSTASKKAFQQMGAAAQSLENAITKAFAKLPAKLQPPALALAPAVGQDRIFQSGDKVYWVLTGPRAEVTDASGAWLLTSGRTNPVEKPLTTPFIKDGLTNGLKAVETMHATATDFGAWTYIYYQLGHRRPELLLLNLGAPAPAGTNGSGNPGFTHVAGGASLVRTGGGTLTLTGANSYTGATIITSGTLVIDGGNAMGSGNLTLTDNIAGAGGLIKSGAGTLTLNSTNTSSGNITVSSGNLDFVLDARDGGTITLGALTAGSNTSTNDGSGNSSDANFVLGAKDVDVTFGGNITDSFDAGLPTPTSLTKVGNGTLTLTGNNSYSGNTTVNAGTLVMTNWSYLTGNIFVLGSGTFEYQPASGAGNLTVSAVAADGSAFPWGDTTDNVTTESDGSWSLSFFGVHIVGANGGYVISFGP